CGAHQTCAAGFCKNDGTCGMDSDCPATQLCVSGQCFGRTTPPLEDGGMTFGCTLACDCKSNEACYDGGCVPGESAPTVLLSLGSDAGALQAALGSPGVVALKGGETWVLDAGLTLAASNVVLSGGWVQCSPTRWVRDPSLRTALVNPNGPALNITAPQVQLRGLAVSEPAAGCVPAVTGTGADGLGVDEVELRVDVAFGCS